MVEKRSKSSRREDTETPVSKAPSDLAQSSAPSDPTHSSLLPELILPAENIAEQNSTGDGVDDQPDSPEARDEEFLTMLMHAPELSKETRDHVINNTNALPKDTADIEKEKSHIWAKAKEAQTAGDEILANVLLKAYGELGANHTRPATAGRTISASPVMITVEHNISTETEKEDGLIYAVGVVTNHQDIGFTPFFDENIKKLKAPLPLTIFDREWQKEALSVHLSARPSKSSEDKAYRGHPYDNEWTQTHSKWTNNHRIFHLTLRDVYNKKLFADKLLIHKMNCDTISDEYGFMTAFRYDMQVRANAFAHRVQSKDGAAIPDISVKQNLVAKRCYNDVRSAGETRWTDNYYAPGGSHAHIDPDTGRDRVLTRSTSHGGGNGHGGRHGNGRQGNAHMGNHNHRQNYFNDTHGYHQTYNNGFFDFERQNHSGGSNNPYPGRNYGQFRPEDNFHSSSSGHSDSRKRMRGYQGSNFTDGYVDKRSGGNKQSQEIKNHNVAEKKQSRDSFGMTENWPKGVRSEMDIGRWHKALTDANLLPELQGVLDGFIHGYDQGIHKHGIGALRWFTPENHSSAVLARDKIHASISQEVEAKRMFGLFTHEEVARQFSFFRTSPLGSVVNADGKMRPINDLSFPKKDLTIPSVNSFVNKSHFETTWDDFNIVAEFFRQNDGQFDLALFDWEKAYRQQRWASYANRSVSVA
ncbi:hypothetical protein PGTUg99_027813 [Puccinia graminis f. sp. tritici]|uniref:Uncharacterized protein n=1 Tax=Puccinia graminis f. sp. tritici TaxID=56615 RepID=A0A5B0P131_PUCGR|nr:hypothetical protein PGTUg99_027813 [Puccinia graminis f. sp. tritici]